MSEREERISNMRFVVSRASDRLPPPIALLLPAALARRVISGVAGFVSEGRSFRSGVRTAAGGEVGGIIMESVGSTLMNDMAGLRESCCPYREEGTLRLKVGLRADCMAAS